MGAGKGQPKETTHLLGQPDDLEEDGDLVIRDVVGETFHDLCLRRRSSTHFDETWRLQSFSLRRRLVITSSLSV